MTALRIIFMGTADLSCASLQALLDHALVLSEAINREKPASTTAAVKALLQGTEGEIRANDRLLSRVSTEVDSLQGLQKWLEEKQP